MTASDTAPGRGGGSTVGEAALAALVDAQREAVLAEDRVLCLLAGAGTGKTRVLTLRVARRLQDRSAHPNHVLVCTFSRKAADELRTRLWTLGAGADVRAGTFHRTALGLIRQHRADKGLSPPTVLADRRLLLAEVLTADRRPNRRGARPDRWAAATAGERQVVRRLEAEIGWAKARLVKPEGYAAGVQVARRRPSLGAARVAELYAAYEHEKRRRGVLDLDDLLLVAGNLLEDDSRFAAAVRWRNRQLFVDEMQDVNPAQFRLLQAVAGDDPDLFVVGDPNQSVYGWNGADPTLLHRFPVLYPQARVVRLEHNHRCSPQVIAAAVAALGLAPDAAPRSSRPATALPRVAAHDTDEDEAAWVAHQAWRAHRPGRRWAQIAVLARTNAQLDAVAAALEASRVPWRMAGGDLAPASDVPPAGAARPGTGSPRAPSTGPPGSGGTVGPGGPTGPVDPEADSDGPQDDAVVLSTFHRAKGLQWQVVFVVGLSDGLVPIAGARSVAARDEERRLLYVAITRAEDELTCSWARHPDRRAAAGSAPRDPSPWLAPVEEVVGRLAAEEAPADPAMAAVHLAGMRRRLATGQRGDAG
ncbi:MAG: ATP-dependent helicase [Acidimicrobiales bacterium]